MINIVFGDMLHMYLMFWKYKNLLQNYLKDKFIFMFLSLQPNTFLSAFSMSLLSYNIN